MNLFPLSLSLSLSLSVFLFILQQDLVDAADVVEAAQDACEGGLVTEELMVMGAAGGAVVAAGAVGGAYVMSRDGKEKDGQEVSEGQAKGQQDDDASDEKDEDEDEKKKKKGMFGKLKSGAGNLATFVADTAKETLVTTVLGDDMGEAVLEAKDGVEDAQEELASDSEKESDDDSHQDDAKDRRSGPLKYLRCLVITMDPRPRENSMNWGDPCVALSKMLSSLTAAPPLGLSLGCTLPGPAKSKAI